MLTMDDRIVVNETILQEKMRMEGSQMNLMRMMDGLYLRLGSKRHANNEQGQEKVPHRIKKGEVENSHSHFTPNVNYLALSSLLATSSQLITFQKLVMYSGRRF